MLSLWFKPLANYRKHFVTIYIHYIYCVIEQECI